MDAGVGRKLPQPLAEPRVGEESATTSSGRRARARRPGTRGSRPVRRRRGASPASVPRDPAPRPPRASGRRAGGGRGTCPRVRGLARRRPRRTGNRAAPRRSRPAPRSSRSGRQAPARGSRSPSSSAAVPFRATAHVPSTTRFSARSAIVLTGRVMEHGGCNVMLEMAVVKPIRAVRYDESVAGPLERLVAPPYDVIDEAQREELRGRSPLERRPPHAPRRRVGRRPAVARVAVRRRSRGDEEPSFWALEQRYVGPDGIERTRRGLVAALKVEPYENRVVLPHERTHAGRRRDGSACWRPSARIPSRSSSSTTARLRTSIRPASQSWRREGRVCGGSLRAASRRRSPTSNC